MPFTPGSQMLLCGGIEIDDTNQITFADAGAQEAYFKAHSKGTLLEGTYSYIRIDRNYLDVRSSFDSIVETNYIMVENTLYWAKADANIKWWYLRIINKEFVNRDTTRIFFVVDAFQSFMFQIRWVPCMVKREMQVNDWLALGVLPSYNNLTNEGYSGDMPMKVNLHRSFDVQEAGFNFLLFSAWDESASTPAHGSVINGVYTGLKMYVYNEANFEQMDELIEAHTEQGKLNDIAYIMVVPSECMQQRIDTKSFNVVQFRQLDGYSPKNGKMLSYPFSYIKVYEFNGDEQILRFEMYDDTENTDKRFSLVARFAGGPVLACIPQGYAGMALDYAHGLYMTDFPLCSFVGSASGQATAQNSIIATNGIANMLAGAAKAAMNTALNYSSPANFTGPSAGLGYGASIAKDAVQAAANSGIDMVSQLATNTITAQWRSDTIRGSYGNAYTPYAMGIVGFFLDHMTIKADAAKRIDDFFTAYGYNTMRLKKPNIRTRPYWNFVQCIDAHVDGRMDAQYKQQIESMLNRGVTFWHVDKGAAVGDYSKDNRADAVEWGEE